MDVSESPTMLVLLIGVVSALIEVVKLLISKVLPHKPNLPEEELQQRDSTRLNVQALASIMPRMATQLDDVFVKTGKMWDMHDHRDQDGVPVWYVPRSWEDTQEKVMEQVRAVAVQLQLVAETTRRSLELIERIERRNGGRPI